MIVDEPACLHEGIADRRADEAKAARAEGLAHRVRLGGARRNVAKRASSVHDWLTPDEGPEKAFERSELLLDDEKRSGVADRRFDLEAVSDDAGVGEQGFDLARVVFRDF